MAKPRRAVSGTIVVMLLAGCGGGGHGFPMEEVQGTVRYQGEPLPGGTVVLHPVDGTPGPQAMAPIQSDGTYRVQTLGVDGAAVGKHVVTVDYRRALSAEESRNLVIPELLIPQRYATVDSTPLRCMVVAGQENTFDIVLE